MRGARGLAQHDHIRNAYESADIDRPRIALLLKAVNPSPDQFARDEQVLVDTISGLPMKQARQALEYWRQAADRRAALMWRSTSAPGQSQASSNSHVSWRGS